MTLNFNGGADELSLSRHIYDILLPAFDLTLRKIQPLYALPSNVSNYVGTYNLQGGGATIVISFELDQLYFAQVHDKPVKIATLEWVDDRQMQFHFTSEYLLQNPCLTPELIALDNSYLIFDWQFPYRYFTWPGNLPGYYFVRQ